MLRPPDARPAPVQFRREMVKREECDVTAQGMQTGGARHACGPKEINHDIRLVHVCVNCTHKDCFV